MNKFEERFSILGVAVLIATGSGSLRPLMAANGRTGQSVRSGAMDNFSAPIAEIAAPLNQVVADLYEFNAGSQAEAFEPANVAEFVSRELNSSSPRAEAMQGLLGTLYGDKTFAPRLAAQLRKAGTPDAVAAASAIENVAREYRKAAQAHRAEFAARISKIPNVQIPRNFKAYADGLSSTMQSGMGTAASGQASPVQAGEPVVHPIELGRPARNVPTATLAEIQRVAELTSSQRIPGWRTPHFDDVKAKLAENMDKNPDVPLAAILDAKADIGPSDGATPLLADAVERRAQRFAESGYAMNIRPVTKLPNYILDYIIIGAGMSGNSGGLVFSDANDAGANIRGLTLEGGNRVGGRAWDVDVNGKKAGLGPSWEHGHDNPLRRLVDLLGLHRERTYLDREVYINGKKASKKDMDALFKEEERAEDAMEEAVKNGKESRRDPATKFFPRSRWAPVAEAEMGRGDQGAEINQVDAIDGSEFDSNQDDFIQEGQQEFVTRIAKAGQISVSFNSIVKEMRQDPKTDVWTLTLKDGRAVRARDVIYTGSTAALKNIQIIDGKGRGLPRAKQEVLTKALPMGNFTKFLFTTKEPLDRPDTFRNSWVVDAVTNKKTGKLEEQVQWVVKYGGDSEANIMFAAGGVADRILKLPKSKQIKYVEKQFEKIAGHPVHIQQFAVTPFASDPLYQGSYSNLLPGMEGAHTVYAAPYRGLHFAGEAAGTAQNNASLLAAHTAGIDAAYDVLNSVFQRRKK